MLWVWYLLRDLERIVLGWFWCCYVWGKGVCGWVRDFGGVGIDWDGGLL